VCSDYLYSNIYDCQSQVSREAIERSVEKQAEFVARMGLNYTPEQLVFVDESSADHRIGHRRGWEKRGQRAIRKAFFVRGQRYVLLAFDSM
jgi:hypothetical protein